MPSKQPNLDVILERLGQNTKLTQQVKQEVEEGFKTLNGRVSANTRRLDRIEWERERDEQELIDARAEAKKLVDEAAKKAQNLLQNGGDDTAKVGTNKWLLVTLVTIILALITALGAR